MATENEWTFKGVAVIFDEKGVKTAMFTSIFRIKRQ